MKKTKILINYDYRQDPGTTGFYFLKAARALDYLQVYTSNRKFPDDIDIILNIQPCPGIMRAPRAINVYYEIDNHITLGSARDNYRLCDILYVAQPYFMPLYDHPNTRLLLLGYDPDIHTRHCDELQIYDVGCIGNTTYPERQRLLDLIASKYKVLRGIRAPGELYARAMSQCKILFNRSLDNDINMRFFESLGIGIPFITDKLYGQELFNHQGIGFYEYENDTQMLEQIDYILGNYKNCLKTAQRNADIMSLKNTYAVRLQQVLADCEVFRKEHPRN